MSDTPRTDAAIAKDSYDDPHPTLNKSALAKESRTIERELAQMAMGPTEAMIEAGARAFMGVADQHSFTIAEHIYRAMLSAERKEST